MSADGYLTVVWTAPCGGCGDLVSWYQRPTDAQAKVDCPRCKVDGGVE